MKKNRIEKMFITGLLVFTAAIAMAEKNNDSKQPESQPSATTVRMAVVSSESLGEPGIDSKTLEAQIESIFASNANVKLISRKELNDVAEEQGLNLSGLVDEKTQLKLGRFVSAQYIVCGSLAKIGSNLYLLVKIINVETTEQTTLSAKSASIDGIMESCVELLSKKMPELLKSAQLKGNDDNTRIAELRKAVEKAGLSGKTVMVAVNETHVNMQLADPAAQTAVVNRLKEMGFKVFTAKSKDADWQESLMASGKFESVKIDYLVSGEAVSSFAGRIKNLVSCRARVELNWIPLPGTLVTASQAGKEPGIDLNEPLAAKTALSNAAVKSIDAMMEDVSKVSSK